MKWKVILNAVFLVMCVSSSQATPVRIALTIDDVPAAGPPPVGLSRKEIALKMIEVLKKHRVHQVYGFINGILVSNMAERDEIMKLWKGAGHKVGNHTYSHLDLSRVTAEEYIKDIEKNESTLIDYASSISELKMLRYPYLTEGQTNEKRYGVRFYLKKRDYKIAPVSMDFQDWNWIEAYLRCKSKSNSQELSKLEESYLKAAQQQFEFAERAAQRLYDKKPFAHVFLIHFSQLSGDFLDKLLTLYEKLGAKWVTLEEALKSDAYLEDTNYLKEEGVSFLQQMLDKRKINMVSEYQPNQMMEKLSKVCL